MLKNLVMVRCPYPSHGQAFMLRAFGPRAPFQVEERSPGTQFLVIGTVFQQLLHRCLFTEGLYGFGDIPEPSP